MSDDLSLALKAAKEQLIDLDLKVKILSYALRGAIHEMNPNAHVAARRMANTAVLAGCPADERAHRLKLLMEVFPEARDASKDADYLPQKDT